MSKARLREMEDNSDEVRDLQEPHGTGFHCCETGLQCVRKTTKKVIPKDTSRTMRETAHRWKVGVVKIRRYNARTANLMAVVLKIHVVEIATRTFSAKLAMTLVKLAFQAWKLFDIPLLVPVALSYSNPVFDSPCH